MGSSTDQKQYGTWLRAEPTKNQQKEEGKKEADHLGRRTESCSSSGSTDISKEKRKSSMGKKFCSYQSESPGKISATPITDGDGDANDSCRRIDTIRIAKLTDSRWKDPAITANTKQTTGVCDKKWKGTSVKEREAKDIGAPEISPKRKEYVLCKDPPMGYNEEVG
ncbi:hypothetical protein U1Q18_017550 [Sarracenia purpurea var. burkii]